MLSKYELELVTNADIILTKNRIIEKVYGLFGDLNDRFVALSSRLPPTLLINSPKISRGENYLGLPYVMLDNPRNFSKSGIFAIRTFFWWGNFFSITLHLSGNYLTIFEPNVKAALSKNMFNEWYVSTGEKEWDHHFESTNYTPVMQLKHYQGDRSFLKLATHIPLHEWSDAPVLLLDKFKLLTGVLAG